MHLSEQVIVKGSAYKLGLDGQFNTHVLVDGSLYNFQSALHVEEHNLEVLSANKVYGQTK